ncbi:unnamed protein product [Rotaria socialis]|uniref:F-box domain-containing protein n=1 Tax=Rotaria socialis TaxID=392032 RepID=A0A819YJ76_9BILA|nr:unnamed protein product [Rotaria socialis]CAF3310241.1 unnamed protein product [Rotaria socialis]CAF3490075.1 unnamed protein product [Rotaria socialis]CAF3767393.1 unnamed protein product [Rotaria socialis]CAF3771797.1 unnamed protein product [Rotaria socialis]
MAKAPTSVLNINEIGHIEQLPDEIILYLFENYIRLVDLYVAFYPLNHRRINGIINSARFHANIPSRDIFHIKSFSHFAPQIISLYLSTFCNDLDLSKLVNLRSLHIEKPTQTQLTSIQAEFLPNLLYLSLSHCWYNAHELPRHLKNMAESCPFKNLRYYILPHGEVIRLLPKYDRLHSKTNNSQKHYELN